MWRVKKMDKMLNELCNERILMWDNFWIIVILGRIDRR